MREPAKDAAVLQPVRLGAAGEALRRRIDRRHLLIAILVALLFHLLIVFGFWLIDRLRIRDIGDWSGPVLVKIGIPDAPESSAPDPGPLPEQIDQPQQPEIPVPDVPSETVEETVPEDSTPVQPESFADSTRPAEEPAASETSTSETRPAPEPVPSRVLGDEGGNSYEMNFDGSEDDVGRAGAYEYITSYMPLPEVLDIFMVEKIVGTKTMTPDFIRGELQKYWEPVLGEYSKKPRSAGIVPMQDRPYYWSLLTNYLNYDMADAEWRSAGMRPVVVEFTVSPSKGARGAELSDFALKTRTNDPRVDDAVIYGLSRWVYYNDTDHPVKGRITYRFDR